MGFYEAIWDGKGIGDGVDIEEALQCYALVKPDDDDWHKACLAEGVNPHIQFFASFEAYLDNKDAIQIIPVTADMISSALDSFSIS